MQCSKTDPFIRSPRRAFGNLQRTIVGMSTRVSTAVTGSFSPVVGGLTRCTDGFAYWPILAQHPAIKRYNDRGQPIRSAELVEKVAHVEFDSLA